MMGLSVLSAEHTVSAVVLQIPLTPLVVLLADL